MEEITLLNRVLLEKLVVVSRLLRKTSISMEVKEISMEFRKISLLDQLN